MIFTCTQCGNRITIGDEMAGGQAQCPYCHAITPVPATSSPQGVPMAAPADPLGSVGSPQQGQRYAYTPPTMNYAGSYSGNVGPSQQGFAIAGFVLAFCAPLFGLIFSWIAISRMDKYHNDEGRGFAKAGLIISLIDFALILGFCCLWGAAVQHSRF